MTAKFREGEEAVIVRTCGKEHGRYYHGGQLDDVGLKSQGKIITVDSYDKLLLKLENGENWWVHPDEIDFLDKSKSAEFKMLKGLLPGIQELPRHPVFEIAEQTAVFFVDGKAYSLGTAKDGESFYELRGKRTSLVEIGDFNSLEAITLDRAQPGIERIKEAYAKEAQRDLNVLKNLDGDLDIPQLIFKQVFPYLQDGHYKDKVSALLGVEGQREIAASPQTKGKVTQRLEQIADDIGIEVKSLIGQIEQEGQEQAERTEKQSKLDALFDYEKHKPCKGASLLGKVLDGRNAAIVEGAVYDLIAGSDGYKRHVQVDGKRFSLVEREEERLKPQEFGKDARVKIRKDSGYARQNKGIGTMQGEFGSRGEGKGEKWAGVLFEDGYDNAYRIQDLEFAEEVLERGKQSPSDLENKFLVELGKKTRVDALREHLSRDKIIDLLRTQDAELLAMAGRSEYKGDGFGFVQNGEKYYAYIEVPSFAIKSHYDGNYYLFDKSRVGVHVFKNERGLSYSSGLVMVDNNNHPFLHNVKDKFARLCTGNQDFPSSGKDVGEIIAKRLRRCREVLMFGYTSYDYGDSYELSGNNHYFDQNRIKLEELEKMGVPIIQGGRRE